MRKIGTYLKSLELMENRNYTVELWRASKTDHLIRTTECIFPFAAHKKLADGRAQVSL